MPNWSKLVAGPTAPVAVDIGTRRPPKSGPPWPTTYTVAPSG